jgi:hypothetical protein
MGKAACLPMGKAVLACTWQACLHLANLLVCLWARQCLPAPNKLACLPSLWASLCLLAPNKLACLWARQCLLAPGKLAHRQGSACLHLENLPAGKSWNAYPIQYMWEKHLANLLACEYAILPVKAPNMIMSKNPGHFGQKIVCHFFQKSGWIP